MKKLVIFTITLLFLLVFSSVAFAGGWFDIVDPAQHNPDAGKWASESGGAAAKIPHRNISASTNACKTCHAVHDGGSASFKLLHDTSRATECDFCHGVLGALSDPIKKPYKAMEESGAEVPAKGEHTIGAKVIPESNVVNSIQSDGLSCGNCHSVHGANTILATSKILKKDPGSNGDDANRGMKSIAAYGSTLPVRADAPDADPATGNGQTEIFTAFCADCHNKNANWDTGALNAANDETPNPQAHRIGYIDGTVDIYGQRQSVATTSGSEAKGCKYCHTASSPSKFPHQSKGHKLLDNGFTNTNSVLDPDATGTYRDAWDLLSPLYKNNSYTGKPSRPLPNLDTGVCKYCHGNVGNTF